MTTALHIIERAYSKAGIRAEESPLTNSQVQDGLDILNDLLAQWGTNGTLQGAVPVENVDDEVVVPRFADGALKANLAIRLIGEFGGDVTQAMAFDATDSLNELLKASLDLTVSYPSTLPVGSGNQGRVFGVEREFFRGGKKRNF